MDWRRHAEGVAVSLDIRLTFTVIRQHEWNRQTMMSRL